MMPYQNTFAQIYFPLTKSEAVERKIPWYENDRHELLKNIKVLPPDDIPENIAEVDDSILEKAIECRESKNPFRIIKSELDFYRKKNLPLPVAHPDKRMRRRFDMMNQLRLWQHQCYKCGAMTRTSYSPGENLKIYCESCYLREVV